MKKKLFGSLAAVALAATGLVGTATPAEAAYLRCNSVNIPRTGGSDASATICVTYVDQGDNTGFRVTDLRISCRPEGAFEGDMQLNGHSLRIWSNKTADVVWSRSDTGSNVTNNCYRSWNIDAEEGKVLVPEIGGTAYYVFTARLDLHPDSDHRVGISFN